MNNFWNCKFFKYSCFSYKILSCTSLTFLAIVSFDKNIYTESVTLIISQFQTLLNLLSDINIIPVYLQGAAQNSATMASRTVPENSLVPGHPLPTKVSSISTTNENRGVSITRSHEVPGKSSTDGSSSTAGKSSGNLSLDALAKAKKALQMQKELSEKLKKIPLVSSA